ncbi:MAG TPA: Gfo/Idh/MocA family oxidoreductase [Anaerolineaceae bacterium]
MANQRKARIAVIGIGNMGTAHVRDLAELPNTELAAVCDIIPERADGWAEEYHVPAYHDYRDLMAKETLDGVVVATPHYDHTPITIDFLERGVNVLTEKPIAVTTRDARKMIAAYEAARQKYPQIVFSIMFMQRTYGYYQKIKAMIDGGELGRLVRATWIITDWFRTQAYYDGGGWRATWRGEGGGVLLNQCPHNLDLYQWFFGLPQRVTGFAHIGKYHNIEVEDEVTGYFEHANGMVGHFITTTAESPGTNRLEIVGEMGRLVFEDEKIIFTRNEESMLHFLETCPRSFDKTPNETLEVPFQHHGLPGHSILLENFANAILHGEQLMVRGEEGLNGLMLGNAIMLSSFLGQTVEMPIDDAQYAMKIEELAKTSRFQKVVKAHDPEDLDKSFQ